EIRAPAGTLAGVSGFQVNISSQDILTPGDAPQVLVAMNPAALKANIKDLVPGGTVIVNQDNFTKANLKKAGYEENPLENDSLNKYKVVMVPITSLNRTALETIDGVSKNEIDRCQNFFALGLIFWIYDRPLDTTRAWINEKFGRKPEIAAVNLKALETGYFFGETTEAFQIRYRVRPARLVPGTYRKITGNEAIAIGFVTAAKLAGKPLFYGSYPITPASDILHTLAKLKNFDVRTFQAEDEIAAIGATIGAAFGGALALTGTSGPGIALKSEAINLALMLELPVVIVNVQRGGPSTGLPTKTEQSDLLQAMFGRNGESPVPIIAPCTPADCFTLAIEAFRMAVHAMTPVLLLSDGYLANSSEPWNIPDPDSFEPIEINHEYDPETFTPYMRNEKTLARPWAIPGTPGLEHRLGGLEKSDISGNVSYDPGDHQHMVNTRARKVALLQDVIPEQDVFGDQSGELLVVGWGSTFGSIRSAVKQARRNGKAVSHAHLRYINPAPWNLSDVFSRFRRILVVEMNMGQLYGLLRMRYDHRFISLPKTTGQPFKITEILDEIDELLR
ncbi:MAG TPA: 2-oxoacid:acceptor oxidoreductase subunit alpha, partial [Aggregatilineales bacterium]|nr:2-oxoacid:acceptor oxidoreductase subunit alpha [Aggregatilineales bacterium]